MIKKLLAVFLIGSCGFGKAVFAQKENYVWYFGEHAGVDFNSGGPVVLTNSAMSAYEGCSTVSDSNGNILFYTNGVTVWDKNHNPMPNGTGLAGGNSATQAALIVPFTGSTTLYYILTVDHYSSSPNNFNYSVVDMTLNSGNGDVTIKNSLIASQIAEKLTAVKHTNGIDTWVMVHGLNSDSFFAYLVSAGGISATPVTSNAGQIIPANDMGHMKFSPDGSKIAFAELYPNYVDLFDFDPASGIVSDEKHLALPGMYVYGLEFSPGSNYLYCGQENVQSIYQWDITSDSASVINSTLQLIGTTNSFETDAFQIGPDGKIYIAKLGSAYLGAISYPDVAGMACNYNDSAFWLGGKLCNLGLPNFVTSDFSTTGILHFQPSNLHFQIFPNPATDKITISFPATATENVEIKIYSTTGKKVFTKKIIVPIVNYQLSTVNFQNGIYFLSVQTLKETITRKIAVNH